MSNLKRLIEDAVENPGRTYAYNMFTGEYPEKLIDLKHMMSHDIFQVGVKRYKKHLRMNILEGHVREFIEAKISTIINNEAFITLRANDEGYKIGISK